MNSNRTFAVVAGVAFLIATIAQMVGVALVSPILGAPDYLAEISANEDRVLFGALFQFIGGVACTGIATGAVPGVEGAQRTVWPWGRSAFGPSRVCSMAASPSAGCCW